jgi:hypothetical protein
MRTDWPLFYWDSGLSIGDNMRLSWNGEGVVYHGDYCLRWRRDNEKGLSIYWVRSAKDKMIILVKWIYDDESKRTYSDRLDGNTVRISSHHPSKI